MSDETYLPLNPRFFVPWQWALSHLPHCPLKFEPLDELYLELSYVWLHDPEISRLMDSKNFTREEQRAWFASLGARTDYAVWGVSHQQDRIGVVGLKNLTDVDAEFFGYLGDKRFWGKGLGRWLLQFAELCAIRLSLSALQLKVESTNTRAYRLYVRYGYVPVRQLGSELLMVLTPLSFDRASA